MRRLDGFSVDTRFVDGPTGSQPEPSQQFAQDDCADKAKKGDRPGLPEQNVNELVQLRIRHAKRSSSFAA
jgi:hypothetical protein